MTDFDPPTNQTGPLAVSFLGQMLAMTSSHESRCAIVRAVDWNAPDTYRGPEYKGALSDQYNATIHYLHPLSTVILLGDRALFKEALAQANATSDSAIYLSGHTAPLSDWTAWGVLETALMAGSPEMVEDLTHTLLGRARLTQSIDINLSSRRQGRLDPWQALARGKGVTAGTDYKKKIKLIDQYIRAQYRSFYNGAGKPQPADGSGPLSAREKRLRGQHHTYALEMAAKAGNSELVQTLLEMGHARASLKAISGALAVSPLLAKTILDHPNGEAHLATLPSQGSAAARGQDITNQIEMKALIETMKTLADVASRDESEYREAAYSTCVSLVRLLGRFPPYAEGKNQTLADRFGTILLPALLLLDMPDAQMAMDTFKAHNALDTTTLPRLGDWEIMSKRPECAWTVLAGKTLFDCTTIKQTPNSYAEHLALQAMMQWAEGKDPRISIGSLRLAWQALQGHAEMDPLPSIIATARASMDHSRMTDEALSNIERGVLLLGTDTVAPTRKALRI